MAKKKTPITPASPKDAAFWYCKMPDDLIADADKKRSTVKASKRSIVLRMIKWYLRPETEA